MEIDKLTYAAGELDEKEMDRLDALAEKLDDEKNPLLRGATYYNEHDLSIRDIVFSLRYLNMEYFTYQRFDLATYKSKAFDIINKEMPKINTYHGLKQILNLLILIATLGTAHLINKACNGNFLFFKTDLAQQVDSISNTIKTIYKKKWQKCMQMNFK